jgi:RND family efflux transporter MFP subunit
LHLCAEGPGVVKPTIRKLRAAIALMYLFMTPLGAIAQDASGVGDDPSSATASLTISVIQPQSQTWAETVQATGWLEAWQEAIVSAEVGGQRLTAVNVDIGASVKKGDLLAELSSDSIRNDILQREANVLTMQASLEQASAAAARARKLRETGTVSQETLNDALVAEKKAEADLASARAVLASSELSLEQTRILAVDDGVISSRTAALGNVVSAGGELFRLIRQGRIEWRAEVPLKYALNVKHGVKAILPTPIGEVTGAVRLISPVASIKNGRLTVFVDLNPPENAPPPTTGILVSGYFQTGESPALVIPSTAVTVRDGFSYVFVVNGPGETATVSRKRVATGRRQDDLVEIVDGITANDHLVLAGGAFLSDGATVRVVAGAPRESAK